MTASAQRKTRRVVERLTSGIAERGTLLGNAGLIEHLLGVEHFLFCRLEHRVHAPDDAHGKDHVRILPTLEEIAKHVIGNAPDKGNNLVVRRLVHSRLLFSFE
jgi:hypothetical protein